MATFTIDLLSGQPYLFNGNFTNSGMTTFSGITTANNGLTRVGDHIVKLGGTLISSTVLTKGAGNTAGIEYGGDYSASFSDRSLIDKEYVDLQTANITLQLIDNSGNTEVNSISGITIIWTTQEFSGTTFNFTGGSKILITENGIYGVGYTLNFINKDSAPKNIGTVIKKNGNLYITPTTSAAVSTFPYYGAANIMSIYKVNLLAGDYIELVAYRIGAEGSALTIPGGSWITLIKYIVNT
jgi:hypothetical protein